MFGDIEYNYYFFYDAKGEKDMTFFFVSISELSYLAIISIL